MPVTALLQPFPRTFHEWRPELNSVVASMGLLLLPPLSLSVLLPSSRLAYSQVARHAGSQVKSADAPRRPLRRLSRGQSAAAALSALAAGDVVLCAATTLVGRLRTSDSAAAAVVQMTLADANLCAPALGYVERPAAELPSYFNELSEAQQRVLGPREGMPGGPVATDGKDVFAVPADSDAQEPASTLLEEDDL